MAGGDKDHVKTRFQRQNRLYCPILKFFISVVVRSHSSSIWRTCVGGMGRVEIPTKYIFPRGLARGMLWIMESSPRGKKQKQQKTENGKGGLGNVFQHI